MKRAWRKSEATIADGAGTDDNGKSRRHRVTGNNYSMMTYDTQFMDDEKHTQAIAFADGLYLHQ